jgi:hypothetical protein
MNQNFTIVRIPLLKENQRISYKNNENQKPTNERQTEGDHNNLKEIRSLLLKAIEAELKGIYMIPCNLHD